MKVDSVERTYRQVGNFESTFDRPMAYRGNKAISDSEREAFDTQWIVEKIICHHHNLQMAIISPKFVCPMKVELVFFFSQFVYYRIVQLFKL